MISAFATPAAWSVLSLCTPGGEHGRVRIHSVG
jgi:hypothetical protein